MDLRERHNAKYSFLAKNRQNGKRPSSTAGVGIGDCYEIVVTERGVDYGDEATVVIPLSEAVAVGTLSVVASEADQVSRL